MFTLIRRSVRTVAVAVGVASLTASASGQVVLPRVNPQPAVQPKGNPQPKVNPQPQPQPKPNPIVIPAGPKVPVSGIPHLPNTNPNLNPNPIRLMPSTGGMTLYQPRPTYNVWGNPAVANPYGANPFFNPFTPPVNPLLNNNPFIGNNNPLLRNNPFMPGNNPLLNNNPFANPFAVPGLSNPFTNPLANPLANPLGNPFAANPFPVVGMANPFTNPLTPVNPFANPFAVNPFANPVNPFAVNPFVNPVNPANPFANPANPFAVNPFIGYSRPGNAYAPGTLVMAGPNTFVNNATGAVVQPIGGTTFADGTTFYRIPTNQNTSSPFIPYVW